MPRHVLGTRGTPGAARVPGGSPVASDEVRSGQAPKMSVLRRRADVLFAWVGAVVRGLLIPYCLSEGAPLAGISAMTPLIFFSARLCENPVFWDC
jgi:hypothetical protein